MTPSVARELVRSGHLVRSLRLAPFATSTAAAAAYLVARLGDTHDAIGDLRVLALLLALGSGRPRTRRSPMASCWWPKRAAR